MFPISGPFEHFLWKLSEKNLVEGSTVGILVVDPRQSQIRNLRYQVQPPKVPQESQDGGLNQGI